MHFGDVFNLKFNKNKIFELFLIFFTIFLFNISCKGTESVLIGYVTIGDDDMSSNNEYIIDNNDENTSVESDEYSTNITNNNGENLSVESDEYSTNITNNNNENTSVESDEYSTNITNNNDENLSVELGELDGYFIKGNTISFGEKSHLLSYECVPPKNCNLYVRAIKIKDAFVNDIVYNPNTSDTHIDTGWLLYKGVATFDYLASTPGKWKIYAVRYTGQNFKNDYDIERVIFDKSCSIDGINRYTLISKDRKVIYPGNIEG